MHHHLDFSEEPLELSSLISLLISLVEVVPRFGSTRLLSEVLLDRCFNGFTPLILQLSGSGCD